MCLFFLLLVQIHPGIGTKFKALGRGFRTTATGQEALDYARGELEVLGKASRRKFPGISDDWTMAMVNEFLLKKGKGLRVEPKWKLDQIDSWEEVVPAIIAVSKTNCRRVSFPWHFPSLPAGCLALFGDVFHVPAVKVNIWLPGYLATLLTGYLVTSHDWLGRLCVCLPKPHSIDFCWSLYCMGCRSQRNWFLEIHWLELWGPTFNFKHSDPTNYPNCLFTWSASWSVLKSFTVICIALPAHLSSLGPW